MTSPRLRFMLGIITLTLALAVGLVPAYAAFAPTAALGGGPSEQTANDWSGLGVGTNGAVLCLAVDANGILYAGGDFTTAGGVSANHIARWDGVGWSALGAGCDSSVRALVVDPDGTTLYVGGSFANAGPVSANRVAKWAGGTWSALGSGVGGTAVGTMAYGNNTLYAGGDFNLGQGAVANNIAQWNGTSWSSVGSGLGNRVFALALDGTTLYAGGIDGARKWNGVSWSAVGGNVGGTVTALVFSGGLLYAGGTFTSPGLYVAKWNGTSWSPVGNGMNNTVHELIFDPGGTLYACGEFTQADNLPANRTAKFSGGVWTALGTGLDDYALTIATRCTGSIYAGGAFQTAGGHSTPNIAAWNVVTLYRDADHDGYGDPAVTATGCSLAGYVADNTDCDDSNPTVHPNAPEICDGIDNNCNGYVDEVVSIPGLVAWWKGDGDATDAAGDHDGSAVGSVPFVTGTVGRAFGYDGTSGYIAVPDDAALDITSAITVEAWIKTTQGFNQYILTKGEDSFYLGIGPIGTFHDNKPSFWLNSVTDQWLHAVTNVNDGQWHYIAGTYDGAEMRIYVDGHLEGSAPKTGSIATGSDMVYLGRRPSEGIFDGLLDELAISNRALSPDEISTIYKRGRCSAVTAVMDPLHSGTALRIASPWPNPSSEGTNLGFELAARAMVRVYVVDLTGRRVSPVLVNGELPAGAHRVGWDGRDPAGHSVAPGVYFLRVSTGLGEGVKRIVIVK